MVRPSGRISGTTQLIGRYKGTIKGYDPADYPNVESFRKQLCCFKTGMQTMEKVENEMAALDATIRHYS